MPRYVAFLRGVSPTNAQMPELKRAFELAGFADVRTLLSSGNVAFTTPRAKSEAVLARQAEAAMTKTLGRAFATIVRSTRDLDTMLAKDPYAAFRLPSDVKRIVTFLREPHRAKLSLPFVSDGVHVLAKNEREVYIAYEPNPKGPVFMKLIEQTFGTDVTTRTWDSVRKCAAA